MRLLGEVTLAFLAVVVWGLTGTAFIMGALALIGWPAAVAVFCVWEIGSVYVFIRGHA